jgi:BirA family biotin operon repressor/biotin-[acetyl-CoA-carboxylase] ligase
MTAEHSLDPRSNAESLRDFAEDTLDGSRIRDGLSPTALAELARLDVVETIDSTNSELLRRQASRDGASVLFAERQTGGRGRQGRVWVSPPACNLYLSIARHFAGDLARLGGLSIVVGAAAAQALRDIGLDAIALKWPNDLAIVDGERLLKLGGVLIESGGVRDNTQTDAVRAVIGLGLNVRMRDAAATANIGNDAIDQPWTDVRSLLGAGTPSRNAIAAALLDGLLPALTTFDRDGLSSALETYARFDCLRGRMLETRGGARTLVGIGAGLADDGALRLRTESGEALLRAGEVGVRPHAPSTTTMSTR